MLLLILAPARLPKGLRPTSPLFSFRVCKSRTSVLSQTLEKNNTEALFHLFVQIVRLCKQLGLVGLGHISLDPTVIKANAYREKTYDREKLILEEKAVEKKIKELLDAAQATDDEEDRIFGISSRGDEIPKELRSQEKRLEKLK